MDQATPLQLADIVRHHGAAFLRQQGGWLSQEQQQALRAVARCRTAALGGHIWQCGGCGQQLLLYNSCRNRHCPQCQAGVRARWVQQQQHGLLPVDYYHVVFTLPQQVAELALLCWSNRRPIYELLFRAAAATVQEVAANPKHLGAQVGLLLVLHTSPSKVPKWPISSEFRDFRCRAEERRHRNLEETSKKPPFWHLGRAGLGRHPQQHRQIVHVSGQVREDAADPAAAFAVLPKLEGTLQHLARRGRHRLDVLSARVEGLAVPFDQLRFVIERVDLAGSAVHE